MSTIGREKQCYQGELFNKVYKVHRRGTLLNC